MCDAIMNLNIWVKLKAFFLIGKGGLLGTGRSCIVERDFEEPESVESVTIALIFSKLWPIQISPYLKGFCLD